jgi:hypothetical protein
MDGWQRDWTLRLRSIKFIVLCIEFQSLPSIHPHLRIDSIPTCWEKMQRTSMEGIVSNQTQQQVRRSEGERAESNGDREEDRFLRRSLISSHLISSASFSQGIRNVIIRLKLAQVVQDFFTSWEASQNTKLSLRSDAIARDHCQRIDPIKITRNIIDRIHV